MLFTHADVALSQAVIHYIVVHILGYSLRSLLAMMSTYV